MAHVTRKTHDMCQQGVKPADRGRSVSPKSMERHKFSRLWTGNHCQKTRGIVADRIGSKYVSVKDVAFASSTAAVNSIWNALRSETILVSLDVLETSHKYFPKDLSSLGTHSEGIDKSLGLLH